MISGTWLTMITFVGISSSLTGVGALSSSSKFLKVGESSARLSGRVISWGGDRFRSGQQMFQIAWSLVRNDSLTSFGFRLTVEKK